MASPSKGTLVPFYAVAALSVGTPAFQSGDHIKFTENVHAHADRDVRRIATNKVGVISKGTLATVVVDGKYPPQPGGKQGDTVCIEIQHSTSLPEKIWVYFNSKFPWMEKAEGGSDEGAFHQPKLAQAGAARSTFRDTAANRRIASDTAPLQTPEPPAPAPEPTRFGLLSFAPSFSYSKITMVDSATLAEASLLSGLNYGGKLTWTQHWSKDFETSLDFSFQQETYSSVDSDTLTGSSHMMSGFGLNAKTNIAGNDSHPLSLEFGLHDQQTLFAEAISLTDIQLVTVAIPTFSLGLDYKALSLGPFAVDPYVKGMAYLPTSTDSFSVNSGIGYALGLKLIEAITPAISMTGDAGYSFERQNTSIESMQRVDIHFSLGVSFRL